jgi:FtsP/CotA-like multicopper oxidase with cupredoxin domain
MVVLPRTFVMKGENLNQNVFFLTDNIASRNPLKDLSLINLAIVLRNQNMNHMKTVQKYGKNMTRLMEDAFRASQVQFPFSSHCINGRCESSNSSLKLPLEIVNIKPHKVHRFRFINGGIRNFYLLSVDQHKLTLVAVDGNDVEPVKNVEQIVIAPAERIDFLIEADQRPSNYWIRALTIQHGCGFVNWSNPAALGILRYEHAPVRDPQTLPHNCKSYYSCKVVGCFSRYHFRDRYCMTWNDIDSANDILQTSSLRESDLPTLDKVIHLNFDFINVQFSPRFGINYKSFKPPKTTDFNRFTEVSSLYIPDIRDFIRDDNLLNACNKCKRPPPDMTQFCKCFNTVPITAEKKIDYVYIALSDLNRDNTVFRPGVHEHPIHIHGHTFEVIKYGLANMTDYSPECQDYQFNLDINCDHDYGFLKYGCLNPRFNRPLKYLDLKTTKPVQKDTVVVPMGG